MKLLDWNYQIGIGIKTHKKHCTHAYLPINEWHFLSSHLLYSAFTTLCHKKIAVSKLHGTGTLFIKIQVGKMT
jgi:hypothetical protein